MLNRLVVRLVLAMVLVSLLSLIIIPIAQTFAARQTLNLLAPDFRERVRERTQPPPLLGGARRKPPKSQLGRRAELNQTFVDAENARLFDLLSNYRRAQRQAVFFGVLLTLGLGISLAILLAKGIAKPIEAVSRAAADLSKGDLSTRVPERSSRYHTAETRELAQDFNDMAKALEDLESQRKAMTADIAHELRNPLAILQLRLDALDDGVVSFNKAELDVLKEQVGLLSRLIDDLKTLSLADAGQLSLYLRPVELTTLIRQTLRTYQEKAKQQEITLSVSLPNQMPKINVDADRIMQIVRNLLDNAFKLTDKGGWVSVECLLTEQLLLRIKDSGPGIPEAQKDTIFERFVQGQRRDVKGKEGSGLGLAIVKALVEAQGGEVYASNHQEGAQFDVIFPLIPSSG